MALLPCSPSVSLWGRTESTTGLERGLTFGVALDLSLLSSLWGQRLPFSEDTCFELEQQRSQTELGRRWPGRYEYRASPPHG